MPCVCAQGSDLAAPLHHASCKSAITRHPSMCNSVHSLCIRLSRPLFCLPPCLPFQLTLGRAYPRAELLALSNAYQEWVGGLSAWPWLNIPFTPYAKALKARQTMIQHFQEATDAGRAKMARGEEVPGLLGILISSVDEEGHRWVDIEDACSTHAGNASMLHMRMYVGKVGPCACMTVLRYRSMS